MRRYLNYWGKAQPEKGWTQRWHPAAYHCLDVAAVARKLLDTRPHLLVRLCGKVGVEWSGFVAGATQLIALHDLGKLSDAFQLPYPETYDGVDNPSYVTLGGRKHHTHLLQAMFAEGRGPLDPETWPIFRGWKRSSALSMLRPITGHHGQPPIEKGLGLGNPKGVDRDDLRDGRRYLSDEVRKDVEELLGDIQGLFPVEPWPELDPTGISALGWALAGLTVQCDWVGSSREWFPYHRPDLDLSEYWSRIACPRATKAISLAGLKRVSPVPETGLRQLYPHIDMPRPMQTMSEVVGLPSGPSIVVIEDVAGSGKTEAAIVLAHRMIANGKGDGIFIALPTMATSDAIYSRATSVAERLYAPGTSPDIVLSHGDSTRNRRKDLDRRRRGDGEEVADYIESWIASDRRSALLADMGVGTIDQAVLAVLPSKHQSLRLYGLAGKILVIDEAHAYDAYMFEEILALLRFHAFLGGSAIVMSATLSMADRARLFGAFNDGLGVRARPRRSFVRKVEPAIEGGQDPSYPAIHVLGGGAPVFSRKVDPYEGLVRTVRAKFVHSWDDAYADVEDRLAEGGCACVIRSTVDEALATYDALEARGLGPVLLHARFARADRAVAERAVLDRYGPDAEWHERAGGVVVATQVIEQSLDLDFDVMVTDIAPAELIVQRAGRIGRHVELRRRVGAGLPHLPMTIVCPDPDRVEGSGWLNELVPGAGQVYPNHGRLWATARALSRRGGFAIPADIRSLVEECSDPEKVPRALQARSREAGAEEMARAGIGRYSTLKPAEGYADTNEWQDDVRIQTRIGAERRPIRLGVGVGGKLQPLSVAWGGLDWTDSTIEVSAYRLASAYNTPEEEVLVEKARERWPLYEREMPVVFLAEGATGGWVGRCLDSRGRAWAIHYSRVRGLEWKVVDS